MKLLWDFFGPDAERTAVHFEKHLVQFLGSNGQPDLPRGTESAGAGHHAAYCIVPEALVEPMKRALRPNRMLPDEAAQVGETKPKVTSETDAGDP
jgi:hypothetical protein